MQNNNNMSTTMKMINNETNVKTETKLIPLFSDKYVARNAKIAARQSLWVEFLLGHSSHYILEESLSLLKNAGAVWVTLIFGPEGLEFRNEGYTPQSGEVIIFPKIHTYTLRSRPGEDLFNLIRPYLKGAQFCTRKEVRQIMADYRVKKSYTFLPSPPLLVEVEALHGSQSLMEIDAALR